MVDEFVDQSLRVIDLPSLTYILSLYTIAVRVATFLLGLKCDGPGLQDLSHAKRLSKISLNNFRFCLRRSSFARQADNVIHLFPSRDH